MQLTFERTLDHYLTFLDQTLDNEEEQDYFYQDVARRYLELLGEFPTLPAEGSAQMGALNGDYIAAAILSYIKTKVKSENQWRLDTATGVLVVVSLVSHCSEDSLRTITAWSWMDSGTFKTLHELLLLEGPGGKPEDLLEAFCKLGRSLGFMTDIITDPITTANLGDTNNAESTGSTATGSAGTAASIIAIAVPSVRIEHK